MARKIISFVTAVIFLCLWAGIAGAGTIQLPQTGQQKCYNEAGSEIACAGTGQDGDVRSGVEWPEPRFTVNGDCITDNLTGLTWTKNAKPSGEKKWSAALAFANSFSACGYSTGWRLPNIVEMESLFNAGEADIMGWLTNQGFTGLSDYPYYWSSTTKCYDSTAAWVVPMWWGGVSTKEKENETAFVWPVHGDTALPAQLWRTGQTTTYGTGDDGALKQGVAWPSPRFVVSGQCVTDNLTGLMWPQNANLLNASKTWEEALGYAKDLTLCGSSDWRLPNREELVSLGDLSRYEPGLPEGHPFTNVQSSAYWSSTTSMADTNWAWQLDMYHGTPRRNNKSSSAFVWPVSSPGATATLTVILGGSKKGTVSADGLTCSTKTKVCTGTYSTGAVVDITATVASGSFFDGWTNCTSPDGATCHMTITSDVTVTATFDTPPKAAAAPQSLSFGNLNIAGPFTSKTVAVKNTGKSHLTITTPPYLAPSDAEFELIVPETNPCVSGTILAKNESCTIAVAPLPASPNSWGTKAASLKIESNDPKSPASVKLAVSFIAPKVSAPASLNFGAVKVGTTPSKSIRIKNTGVSNLTFTAIVLKDTSGTLQIVDSSTCTSLPKNGYCDVSIQFAPGNTQQINASLEITTNDPEPKRNPVVTAIKGKGKTK